MGRSIGSRINSTAARHAARWAWLMVPALTLLVALLGWQATPAQVLDIGAPTDSRYLQGFHEREQGALGSFRWAGPQARIIVPLVRGPAILSLAAVGRPGGTPLTLLVDQQPLTTLSLPAEPTRQVHLLLPASTSPGLLFVDLHSPLAAEPTGDDIRRLSVALGSLELRPLLSLGLPPPLPLLLLARLALLAYVLIRLIGMPKPAALPLASLAGALLAAAWGYAPLWIEPYLMPMTVGLLVIVGLLAASWLGERHLWRSPRLTNNPEAPQVMVIAGLAAAAAIIPLYLFIDYGWRNILDWQNLPLLLLPLGLLFPWVHHSMRPIFAALMLVVSAGFMADKFYGIFSGDYASDFHAMYRGVSWMVRGTGPLYDLEKLASNPLVDTYKYPPMFALLLAPLSALSFVPALLTWRLINVLLLLLVVLVLLRAYHARLASWLGAGLVLLLCNLRPISDTLNYGQLDILLLLLIVGGLPLFIAGRQHKPTRRGQDVLAGFWLGAATVFKIYPAYLLGLMLLQRRWQVLGGALLAALLLVALSLLAFGWPIHWTFLTQVLPTTGVGTAWVENQTFNGLLNRLLSAEQVALVPDQGGWVRLATYAWAAALTGLTAWLTRPTGGLRPDIGYGLWIVSMLLILPAAWMHYQALLLLPFFQLLVLARDMPTSLRWPTLACYILAWMLLSHGNLWTFFNRTLYGPFWQLILSYKFVGLLLLYAAIVLSGQQAAQRVPERSAELPGVAEVVA